MRRRLSGEGHRLRRRAGQSSVQGCPATPPGGGGRVDLNRATAKELEALPGIGPSLARAIVEDRRENGPFRGVRDLERVSGIGPATARKLAPLVSP